MVKNKNETIKELRKLRENTLNDPYFLMVKKKLKFCIFSYY